MALGKEIIRQVETQLDSEQTKWVEYAMAPQVKQIDSSNMDLQKLWNITPTALHVTTVDESTCVAEYQYLCSLDTTVTAANSLATYWLNLCLTAWEREV